MNYMQSVAELKELRGPLSLAIGVFDGLHLGHQAVIRHALNEAAASGGTAVVVTFAPHPQRVINPDRAPLMLASSRHRIDLLTEFGVRHLLVIGFTREFAATDPREFITQLYEAGKPLQSICVGHEWAFGKGRSGNLAMLKQLGSELGFVVHGIPAVTSDGHTISSTLVRKLVAAGDLEAAQALLGRPFALFGRIEPGAQMGRTLGFPTANIATQNEQLPPLGVYAVQARIVSNGDNLHQGVLNIGKRPSVQDNSPVVVELHLLDFDRDIYGEDVEVCLQSFLRPERTFESLDELKAQIARDVEKARSIFEQA